MLKLKISSKVAVSPKPTVPRKSAWGLPKIEEPVVQLVEEKTLEELYKITLVKKRALRRSKWDDDELRYIQLNRFYKKLRDMEEVWYQLYWPGAESKPIEAPEKEAKGYKTVQQKIAADRLLVKNPKPKLVILEDPGYYKRQATKKISPLVTADFRL